MIIRNANYTLVFGGGDFRFAVSSRTGAAPHVVIALTLTFVKVKAISVVYQHFFVMDVTHPVN